MDIRHEIAAVKAETLIESLPWLKRYAGRIIVVKFGGNAMVSEELKSAFAEDMAYLRYAGLHPVVVHGGGPQISAALKARGIPSEFRGGYRVTNTEAISVVKDVLAGEINREIVDLINVHTSAVHSELARGVFGDGLSLFGGQRRGVVVDGEEFDLGHVGDITSVDPSSVLDVIARGLIPVVSSIASDADDNALNVNADAAAAALAIALHAAKLVVLTDVAGLYRDWPNTDSLVELISVDDLRGMLPALESGMIPKMTACLDAVVGGVGGATIIDGRIPHSILLEIFTLRGAGTEVIQNAPALSAVSTTGSSTTPNPPSSGSTKQEAHS